MSGSPGRVLALCAAIFTAPSCGEAGPAAAPAPAAPPGTVLIVNEVPLTSEEIDAVGSEFALIEPQDSLNQLRRLAIATTLVPTIAARSIDPERRRGALALAESYRVDLVAGRMPSGPLLGPMEEAREGSFSDLGFALWRVAQRLPVGAWSEVFESAGCFHLLIVKSREEGSLPGLTRFKIGLFNFPYLDAETAAREIDAAIDASRLTFADESWRDAVPAALRYRMQAENP